MARISKLKKEKYERIENNCRKYIPYFKIRTYRHFDNPFLSEDSEKIIELRNYLDDPQKISKHSFYPLLGLVCEERRMSKLVHYYYYKNLLEQQDLDPDVMELCKSEVKKFEPKKVGDKCGIVKERPLRFSSHLDTLVYSKYTQILTPFYEKKLIDLGLTKTVLAYRSNYKKNHEIKTQFSNVCATWDVIENIKSKNNNCYVLAFDLSSFFDNIDHAKLKESWCNVLGVKSLPDDHFNIFKSLTNYSFVEKKYLNEYLNEKKEKTNGNDEQSNNEKFDFREFRKWHYNTHGKFSKNPGLNKDDLPPHGIPQGNTLSGLLSNIYMLDFDIKINSLAEENNGLYRRFCDDIIIVIPHNDEIKDLFIKELRSQLLEKGKALKLHPIDENDKYSKSQCYDFTDLEKITKNPMQYLGFYYDGSNVRIREQSLAKYKRKINKCMIAHKIKISNMRIAELFKKLKNDDSFQKIITEDIIEFETNPNKFFFEKINPYILKHINETSLKVHKKHIYKHYSYLGYKNFVKYALEAASILNSKTIRRQIGNHFKFLNLKLEETNEVIYELIQAKLLKIVERSLAKYKKANKQQ